MNYLMEIKIHNSDMTKSDVIIPVLISMVVTVAIITLYTSWMWGGLVKILHRIEDKIDKRK